MDFLANLAKSAQHKPATDPAAAEHGGDQKPASSTTDLFGSAKLVAEACQAQFGNQPEKVDKAKVAGATAVDVAALYGKLYEGPTADLLGPPAENGKIPIKKYVDQAEVYLTPPPAVDEKPPAEAPAADLEEKKPTAVADEKPSEPAAEETKPDEPKTIDPVPDDDSGEKKPTIEAAEPESTETKKPEETKTIDPADSEGAGDGFKAAEGLLNKISDGNAGAGDFAKAAEEFLEKPSGGGGGEAADYIKAAEGFLKKPSEGGADGGGIGDYIKTAESFLNKQSDAAEDGGAKGHKSEGGYADLAKAAGSFFK